MLKHQDRTDDPQCSHCVMPAEQSWSLSLPWEETCSPQQIYQPGASQLLSHQQRLAVPRIATRSAWRWQEHADRRNLSDTNCA